jgi:hypothetical protein
VLTYEQTTFFRCRFSHLLRTFITINITELQIIALANVLITYLSKVDINQQNHTNSNASGSSSSSTTTNATIVTTYASVDLDIQFVLAELHHIIKVLGPSSVSIVDAIITQCMELLKHPSFVVRSSSAQLICSASTIKASTAVEVLTSSLLILRSKV